MNITDNIEIHDLALFLKKEKTLIIADVHLGFEENLHKQGILVPWYQYKEIKQKLLPILETTRPEKIIVNGDLKHEFGQIPKQEWEEVLNMIHLLKQHCSELVLLKGNHDNVLGPLAGKKDLEPKDHVLLGKTYICHGHKIPEDLDFQSADTIIIAHEHPAITISDGVAAEKFKCFLKGKFQKKTLIVQPSTCLVTEGTDILKEKTLSPFLDQDLRTFEVWVIADEPRYFGKLKNLLA
jgi:putative SbcD/Mre11-related phosphoesterase